MKKLTALTLIYYLIDLIHFLLYAFIAYVEILHSISEEKLIQNVSRISKKNVQKSKKSKI